MRLYLIQYKSNQDTLCWEVKGNIAHGCRPLVVWGLWSSYPSRAWEGVLRECQRCVITVGDTSFMTNHLVTGGMQEIDVKAKNKYWLCPGTQTMHTCMYVCIYMYILIPME